MLNCSNEPEKCVGKEPFKQTALGSFHQCRTVLCGTFYNDFTCLKEWPLPQGKATPFLCCILWQHQVVQLFLLPISYFLPFFEGEQQGKNEQGIKPDPWVGGPCRAHLVQK